MFLLCSAMFTEHPIKRVDKNYLFISHRLRTSFKKMRNSVFFLQTFFFAFAIIARGVCLSATPTFYAIRIFYVHQFLLYWQKQQNEMFFTFLAKEVINKPETDADADWTIRRGARVASAHCPWLLLLLLLLLLLYRSFADWDAGHGLFLLHLRQFRPHLPLLPPNNSPAL